ncbi:XRE family transcriptional regulator [Flavobacterium sp.]|uniref:type II toxin-antitoxin system HicB family antitoxin n=1 Tax=Flavobacterium sp. TaxID=239 RepID=UPI00260CC8DE|nr:XRE family transcriptional regulator [Flavobacterium sp.]
MKRKKRYKFIVEKTATGFSAFSNDLPVFTTGKTMTELQNNLLEALELAFEADSHNLSSDNIELEIDFKQFFQFYRVINSKYLAERIGMNPTLFSHYVNGHKKPSSKQTTRILNGLNEVGRELANLQFVN